MSDISQPTGTSVGENNHATEDTRVGAADQTSTSGTGGVADDEVRQPGGPGFAPPDELVSEASIEGEDETETSSAVDIAVVPGEFESLCRELDALGFNPELSTSGPLNEVTRLRFDLPAGRSTRAVVVDKVAAIALAGLEISQWRSLERYDGVWNKEQGIVEVAIRGERLTASPLLRLRHMLQASERGTSTESESLAIEVTDETTGLALRLGEPSNAIAALLFGSRPGPRNPVTLRFSPVAIATTAEADALVERITDSFSLELSIGFGVSLLPQRLESRRLMRGGVARRASTISFPTNAYPHAPVAMYQAGRDRASSPLVRYWSFYQVLEYFFPKFSQEEAVRQLSRHLRSPAFDPHDDEDVLRAVQLSMSAGKGYGSEEEQLHTTLKAVLTPSEVLDFIEGNRLRDQVEDKKSELSQKVLRLQVTDDLIAQLAQRIYDIRCRIVHSKSGSIRDSGPGLLPGTHHDDLVLNELRLMEFIAQQALLASADRLVIAKL